MLENLERPKLILYEEKLVDTAGHEISLLVLLTRSF